MSSEPNAYQSPQVPPEPAAPKTRSFNLVELLVVVGIIGVLVAMLAPAVRTSNGAARRMSCQNNLKQVALALHNYHDVYGSFPPACVRDERGQPMHSWRILILPFLENSPLYEQYRFDQPWDGPDNRVLADKMPYTFRCPAYEHNSRSADDRLPFTQYVVLTGNETAFPPDRSTCLDDLVDGRQVTLLVVERPHGGVHWMAPDDLTSSEFIRDLLETNDARTNHPGGVLAALADGSVQFLSESLAREKLRALVTIAGGEPTD